MIPDFIIAGSARGGTTSLYHYLSQHPQIFMSSIKETNFFAYLASQTKQGALIRPNTSWPAMDIQQYHAFFDARKPSQITGEASPYYFFTPGVPEQIKKHAPEVKLIMILRHPVERAYSAYLKNRREGIDKGSFEEAIYKEINNPSPFVQSQDFYIRAGLYSHYISSYLEHFDRSQIKIVFYDDLEKNTHGLLADIFSFIHVDTDFQPDISVRFNEALPPLIKGFTHRSNVKKITRQFRRLLPQRVYFSLLQLQLNMARKVVSYPALSEEMRTVLHAQYVQDIKNLESLTGRDLSHWQAPK